MEEMRMEEVKMVGKVRGFREFLMEEDGIGVVEMILILVVLIGIVLIFKTQLTSVVNSIFKTIKTNIQKV